MRIGLLVADCGDGSSDIRFFKDVEVAVKKMEDDEEYFNNEEVTEIDVQADFTPPGGWSDE